MAGESAPLRVAVIMAGGVGQRFWPLSRRERPKQLLPLTHPHWSMLEDAVRRIEPLIPPERIFVITSADLVEPIRKGGTPIPPENVLAEPARRNTSGCLAFAAAWFLARFDLPPEAISMSVLTSDHRIEDPEAFRATIQGIWQAVERHDALGVVGIKPCRPDTGVGYIEIAAGARPIAESEPDRPIFPVARFREKPNLELAEHFLSTGRCYWNSGMFFWRLSTFLREADRACPRLSQAARAMAQAIRDADSARAAAVFETIEYQSIDIALIERSENVLAAPGLFSWMDVGSWDGYYRAHAKDANGNVATGDPVLVDVRDSVIFNESGSSAFAVSVIGVRDLAVIVSRDALLVVPMSRAQDVRRAVEELESRGARQL